MWEQLYERLLMVDDISISKRKNIPEKKRKSVDHSASTPNISSPNLSTRPRPGLEHRGRAAPEHASRSRAAPARPRSGEHDDGPAGRRKPCATQPPSLRASNARRRYGGGGCDTRGKARRGATVELGEHAMLPNAALCPICLLRPYRSLQICWPVVACLLRLFPA
jgi:hypothetical protein